MGNVNILSGFLFILTDYISVSKEASSPLFSNEANGEGRLWLPRPGLGMEVGGMERTRF